MYHCMCMYVVGVCMVHVPMYKGYLYRRGAYTKALYRGKEYDMTTNNTNNTNNVVVTNNKEISMTSSINQWLVRGSVAAHIDDEDEGNVSLIQIDSSMASEAIAKLERFTGVSEAVLDKEARLATTEEQDRAIRILYNMGKATSNKEEKAMYEANRRAIIEANEDEGMELDRLIAEQKEDDSEEENWSRALRTSQAKRSYEVVEWLKVNAPSFDVHKLIRWSKKVNDRRFNPQFKEDQLSYCHWVAAKIIIELWISKKSYGKVKARAAQEFAKRRHEWDTNKLGERYDAHLFQDLGMSNEIDMDASFMGKCGVSAARMADFLDILKDKDEDLLKGFLLFRERDGFQLPQGKEAKNFANILIALSRCNGNKTAAAKLLGVARSTYNGWVKQAEKQLLEMATPVAESVLQGLIYNRRA